jgi:RNA recognition motif. (a.k.a. RRM, RBD, or RNP domain)
VGPCEGPPHRGAQLLCIALMLIHAQAGCHPPSDIPCSPSAWPVSNCNIWLSMLQGDPFKTLFVGRLSYDITEKRLRREFEEYGPIKSISIVHNIKSGASLVLCCEHTLGAGCSRARPQGSSRSRSQLLCMLTAAPWVIVSSPRTHHMQCGVLLAGCAPAAAHANQSGAGRCCCCPLACHAMLAR